MAQVRKWLRKGAIRSVGTIQIDAEEGKRLNSVSASARQRRWEAYGGVPYKKEIKRKASGPEKADGKGCRRAPR